MGLTLAVVLLVAIRFVALRPGPRPENIDEHAAISIEQSAAGPELKDAVAANPPGAGKLSDPPTPGSSASATVRFIGNRNTGSYHQAGCYHLKGLAKDRQVSLESTVEAAEKKFKPCKTCNPQFATVSPTQIDASPDSNKKR